MPAVLIPPATMQSVSSLLGRTATILLALLLVLYSGDYAVLRMRGEPTEAMEINKFYAVPQKDGKTEYEPGEPETRTCVNSIFPHLGDSPCWYLKRHKNEQVNL